MKKIITFTAGLIFSFTLAQSTINKTYPAGKNQNLNLKFDYPQLVKISTWDKNEIQITGKVSINDGENNNAFQIKESTEGNTLTIQGKVSEASQLPHRITVRNGAQKLSFKTQQDYLQYCKDHHVTFNTISNGADIDINLEIKVPRSLKTQIESTYGLVEVKNYEGDIYVNAIYGGIDATIAEKKTDKVSADTYYGQVYTNLDAKLVGKEVDNFRTLVSATPGAGSQYNLQSKYGNIYLRK